MKFHYIILSALNNISIIFGIVIHFPNTGDKPNGLNTITQHVCLLLPWIASTLLQISMWINVIGSVYRLGFVLNPKAYVKIKNKREFSGPILILVLTYIKFPNLFSEFVSVSSYFKAANQTMFNGDCGKTSNLIVSIKSSSLMILPTVWPIMLHLLVSSILIYKLWVIGDIKRRCSYMILLLNIIHLIVEVLVILVLVFYAVARSNQPHLLEFSV
jgi:hypothetical protein